MILIYHYDYVGAFQVRACRWLVDACSTAGDELAVSDLSGWNAGSGRCARVIRQGLATSMASSPTRCPDRPADRPPSSIEPPRSAPSHGFKIADSIHLAAAVESGCDRFLTNDAPPQPASPGIAVEILP